MKNENIVSILERLVTEANALSEGKSSVEIEEDPRICGLMLQAEPLIEELDQIVDTAFPNHPEKVAIWKKAMGIDVDDDT
ncbi:MAG TPA: hypothetical protein VK582_26375 [Pyrinomonadaceae bacterium]|nr:hypothetical protein [Pyrinomonadaceae bacterium]